MGGGRGRVEDGSRAGGGGAEDGTRQVIGRAGRVGRGRGKVEGGDVTCLGGYS